MWKTDLHNHLGSKGANPGFNATIDLVHSKLGDYSMFGIANSDDYRFERFVEQDIRGYERGYFGDNRAVYVPSKNLLVIKCQEMFTKEGHILAIGMPYSKNVKSKDAKDAIKEAKDLGAVLSVVHPFYHQGIGKFLQENIDILPEFSTFEAYNGSAEFSFPPILPTKANFKAASFYSDNLELFKNYFDAHIGISSATDGHSVRVIGKCYTELDLPNDFYHNTNSNLISQLDFSLRSIVSSRKLHMEPNAKDAAIHAVKMGLVKLGLRSD